MPAKEIKELRQAGKLVEAYAMAKAELEADLSNIWGKRNLSWVLYAQLDESASNLDAFLAKIDEVKELELPVSEEMFFDNISIVIAKAARVMTHEAPMDITKLHRLFDSIKDLSFKRNSKWFSVLFNAMHKGMKESHRYIEFADWWDFKNFRPEDFQKERLPNGKYVMSIAEQAYIAYAKHLLPKQSQYGETTFSKEKAENFLPVLSRIVEDYPQLQYPGYFMAKLLLALGSNTNALESLLPFARKKRNDFWVWEILADAFQHDQEKTFACYCRALSCKSPEEMLVKLRQKMAGILISKKHYNEAKTEIELLVKARNEHGFRIPNEVINWQATLWYKDAIGSETNHSFYKSYASLAEGILFNDASEELVIVTNVNSNKKLLDFIASESRFGSFKYERFISDVYAGDVLKVRFNGGKKEGIYQIYTAVKSKDDTFKQQFLIPISGIVTIREGKAFGLIDNVFVSEKLVSKMNLKNGMTFSGTAIKAYNKEKQDWGWRLLSK